MNRNRTPHAVIRYNRVTHYVYIPCTLAGLVEGFEKGQRVTLKAEATPGHYRASNGALVVIEVRS